MTKSAIGEIKKTKGKKVIRYIDIVVKIYRQNLLAKYLLPHTLDKANVTKVNRISRNCWRKVREFPLIKHGARILLLGRDRKKYVFPTWISWRFLYIVGQAKVITLCWRRIAESLFTELEKIIMTLIFYGSLKYDRFFWAFGALHRASPENSGTEAAATCFENFVRLLHYFTWNDNAI